MSTLKNEIYNFVAEKRNISFAEIRKQFPSEVGDCGIAAPENPSIIFWDKLSEDLCVAILELHEENKIYFIPTNSITYLADGIVPSLPIAKDNIQYKSPRWFPVLLDIEPSKIGKVA